MTSLISNTYQARISLFRLFLSIFLTGLCSVWAQPLKPIKREPANYVPNDDVIVVPLEVKMGFYEKHIENDKSENLSRIKQQVKIWQESRLMADQYGLDANSQGSYYFVPQPKDQWQYISRSYFRYLRKKGEDPLKDESRDIMRAWNSDKEVNSIDEMEATFRATNKKTLSGKSLPDSLKEKDVGGTKRFRLHFQPRLEQGLLIFRVTSAIVDGRAWVGINGESEFNLQRTFASTGTRVMYNYFTNNGQYLTSIDQPLGRGFSARYTQSKNPNLEDEIANDNRYQLNFNAEF